MAGNRRVTIEILGDAKGVGSAFRDVENAADGVEKKTTQSFGQFTKSIKGAETASGKFSAFTGGAMDQVKNNAGALALVGGAAIASFAIGAVHEFEDTAKAALDLSTSTGLATEDASRWIAVGDDFQVGADALATGLGKVSKTMDDTKWAEYGIATRDASGQARDANDILLDSFDMLSKVRNETERTRIGQELFGKGYQSLTPILGHTRAEYEKMLGAVENGQVITAKEADKAEKMRLAEDNLADALNDVKIAVGGVVANLSPMIDNLADSVTQVSELTGKLGPLWEQLDKIDAFLGAPNPWKIYKVAVDMTADAIDTTEMSLSELNKMLEENNITGDEATGVVNGWFDAHLELNPELEKTGTELGLLAGLLPEVSKAEDIAAQSTGTLNRGLLEMKVAADNGSAAFDAMLGTLNDEESLDTATDNLATLQGDLMLAWAAGRDGAADAAEKAEVYTDSLRKTKQSVIEYGDQIGLLPKEKETLLTLLDNGQIAEVERRLNTMMRNRTMSLSIVAKGGIGAGAITSKIGSGILNEVEAAGAEGGIINRPTLLLAGEVRREALIPLGDSPGNSPLGLGFGIGAPIIINLTVQGSVMTERDLVRSVTDGIIDGQRRGEIPAGAFN